MTASGSAGSTATGASGQTCTVSNQLNVGLIVYSTFSNTTPTYPLGTESSDYSAVYTQLTTVPANSSATFATSSPGSRLVLAQQSDQFPVLVWVSSLSSKSPTTTVTSADLTSAQSCWTFYLHGGYPENHNGAHQHYSYANWEPRWRPEGSGGWYLVAQR